MLSNRSRLFATNVNMNFVTRIAAVHVIYYVTLSDLKNGFFDLPHRIGLGEDIIPCWGYVEPGSNLSICLMLAD